MKSVVLLSDVLSELFASWLERFFLSVVPDWSCHSLCGNKNLHQFSIAANYMVSCGGAGANPSCPRVQAGLQLGQVAGLSQGHRETK